MDFAAVARRFEAKHLQLSLALATESIRFGEESAAAFGGAGGYSNRAIGFALAPDHVDEAIDFFTARGEDTKVETSSFAPAALLERIAARSFDFRFFTHVLALPVRSTARTPPPPGVTIERLDRTDEALVRAAALHNERCFAPPDSEVSEIAITLTSRHLRMPTNDTFIARAHGEIVGVGCSESSHGMTLVFGGAVRPDHRGRGIQQALMNVRLAVAEERGSDLVCVMTGPGTASERNARRAGFQMVSARTFFVRPLTRASS